ncbi:MAG: hypothetical protein R8K22_05120, partial [Mariprofundaceae bacterium]
GTFRGALMPANLSASKDGNVWCFDSSLQKTRRARILDDYKDGYQHEELMGQTWRMYHSDAWRWKAGYWATETGTRNDFEKPALFIFDRKTSQLTMIPNAFGGAISPDGKQVVFTREMDGNYDLWTQKIDGSGLVQLTTDTYGDFEPSFSPNGKNIVFISNRAEEGNVRKTSIYTMNLKDAGINNIHRITNSIFATDGGPTWKDDDTIIFHSNRDPKNPQGPANANWNLWQVNL